MKSSLPTIKIKQTDNPELLALDFKYSATIVELVRGIPGAHYVQLAKSWAIPVGSLGSALRALAGVPHELDPRINPPSIELASNTDVKGAAAADAAIVDRIAREFVFKTTPFAHQRTGMAIGVVSRIFAYLMEMGTGKTKTTIDSVNWWLQIGEIGGVLVVCPKAVINSWDREFAAHSATARTVCVITGDAKRKRDRFRAGENTAQVFVTNYATLRDSEFEDALARVVARRRLAVVLDESSNIANHKSQQSKACYRIGSNTRHKLILNGTPIANGPLDAFGQFYFLDPNILGHRNFTSFKAEYSIAGGFKNKSVIGYKNLDRMQQRIAKHSYRVRKQDCLDLPEKLYRTVELDMPPKMLAAYRELRDEAVVERDGLSVAVPLVLTRLMRLQQITSGYLPVVDEFGKELAPFEFEEDKLDAVQEMVEQAASQNRKVIVWSRFVRDIQRAHERLKDFGAVQYHGGVSDADRQAAVDKFQNDPGRKVFVGQSHTGGIGITLTAATVEIYMANSFSYLDRAQSEDRAHRIGQRNNVDIVDVVMRGTVDTYLLKCLRDKKDLASVVTGDNMKEIMGNA